MTEPLEPPQLDNFTWVRRLGGGGFADVHLYEQRSPSRSVAIKVLRTPATDERAMRVFEDEANLMARISDHPNIVSVHEVGIADDNRPYIVMEFYSRDHLGHRVRAGGMDLTDVLVTGVQIGSALETAHRADIVHRDVKPANILVGRMGDPALTDFGIAGVQSLVDSSEEVGLSLLYAAPEVMLGDSRGDVATDIYSFAATLYALLAGRAPFQIPGGDNAEDALMTRASQASGPPPIAKSGLRPSVEHLLNHALQRDPRNRPNTVAEFAAALQGIESELGHRPTPFRVEQAEPSAPSVPDVEGGTRAKAIQVVRQPTAPPARLIDAAPHRTEDTQPPRERARVLPDAPEAEDTFIPDRPPHEEAQQPEAERRLPGWIIAAVGAGLVLVVILAIVLAGGGDDQPPADTTPDPNDDDLVILEAAPVPADVTVTMRQGDTVAVVSWDPGTVEDGDQYVVQRTDTPQPRTVRVDEPSARFEEIRPSATPCFTVNTVRSGQTSDPSAEACAPT